MGCINESGCLGPKRRERDVYVNLLDSIHEEAQKIQFTNNLNIYSVIRQKIVKKGYIRKLLDNLTSHRSKISECLAHNLRLTTQSKSIENKYAGLIVLNQIVNNLYQEKKKPEPVMNQQKTVIKSGSSQSKFLNNQQKQMNTTCDLRSDLHFFRLILHLLENEGRMYSKTLESINLFCNGRKEWLACKAEIWRVLELILQRLQRGQHIEESATAYLALIEQLKESNQEENDYEKVFLAFIRLWLQKNSEGEMYEGVEVGLQVKYERILKVLVRRCISSSGQNAIYRALFVIYDQERFSGPKALATQHLLFRIIQENDLHSSVIRGVFLYMLQYLSIAIPKEKNASFRASGTDQFHLGRYPKIVDKSARLRAFETLRRWGEKGYLHLEEYVSFSTSALVRAYSINLNYQKEFTQDIMRQFLKLTEQFNPEFTLILVSLLMEEIRWQTTDQNLRQTLIALVRQVIEARHLLSKPPKDHFMYFIPLHANFSRDARLELIQLMGFIAKQIPSQYFSITENAEIQFLQSLCQFLHSVYESMMSSSGPTRPGKKPEDDEILFKYQFSNSVISFLKCLAERGAYPLVLAFLASINSCLSEGFAISKLGLYFLLYVLYEGMHLLNSKQKVPDKMAALNFRLAPSLKGQQISPEIDKIVDHLVGSHGELIKDLVSNLHTIIGQLKQFTMISIQEYNQASNLFSDYFKSGKKGSFYLETSKNQFKRESYNGSANDSSRGSKMEDEDSFKDVIEKIMNI